jgi:hypothetical protein
MIVGRDVRFTAEPGAGDEIARLSLEVAHPPGGVGPGLD